MVVKLTQKQHKFIETFEDDYRSIVAGWVISVGNKHESLDRKDIIELIEFLKKTYDA